MIKVASVYIMTMVCQYLKTKTTHNLKELKRSLQKTFIDFVLEIVAKSNLRIVNFLDMTLNLNNDLLSTCQHSLKNGFQTTFPMTKYVKNQPSIMKIH